MSSSSDSSPEPADSSVVRTPPEVIPPVVGSAGPANDLPEYEPLTPELVEDEAVRGDFVIRWATVLLALLYGWTQVQDTSLLVRIRRGGEHPLPFGADPFSATAGDRSWANLAWLSDPILAAAYGVLGDKGLTILGALTAAATFWFLSRASVKGVSTWWSSACAALGIVAVFPQLVPGPTGITLLGVAVLSSRLHRWAETKSGFDWQIPAIVWVWAQLDTRAWVGALLLLAYAASWVGLRGKEEGDAPEQVGSLAKMAGLGLLTLLIHPFHVHSLLAPWTAFAVEYPEMREYKVVDWPSAWQWYGLSSPEFRSLADQFAWAGIGMCAVALATMALNFRRMAWEWALPWVVTVGLAVACGHFLPVAALLSCVVAGINGQRWYRAVFAGSYTTDLLPLLWNRGGRAITVVGLLLLGLMANNGMLMGRDGRRIGAGFSPLLKANIDSSLKIREECYSPEVFNFRIEQGDVLIWAGLKPFTDTRLSLYAGGGENLLELHRKVRPALLKTKGKLTNQPDVWKPAFAKYKIRHAVPRLTAPNPDYATLVEMLYPDWTFSSIQAAGALLSRTEADGDEAYAKFLKDRPSVDFVKAAFRTEAPKTPPCDGQWIWPRRVTVYDEYLWRPQTTLNESLQLATHEQRLVELLSADPNTIPVTTALALSAFRHCRAGIALDPQSAEGYRIMARAAMHLSRIDSTLAGSFQSNYQDRFWLSQALHAFHHALKIDPNNALDHAELASLMLQQGQVDLSRRHLLEFHRLTGQYSLAKMTQPQYEEAEQQGKKTLDEMNKHLVQVETRIREQMKTGAARTEMVQFALQAQCPLLALKLLDEDKTVFAKDYQLQAVHARLLAITGRVEEALTSMGGMVSMLPKSGRDALGPGMSELRNDYALNSLAIGDNIEAETRWQTESELVQARAAMDLLGSSLMESQPAWAKDFVLPASLSLFTYQALVAQPDRWAALEFVQAQSELSTWRNAAAQKRFEKILETEPTTSLRPMVQFYLSLLTGKSLEAPAAPAVPAEAAPVEATPAPAAAPVEAPKTEPAVESPPATTPAATPDPATPEPAATETSPTTVDPPKE